MNRQVKLYLEYITENPERFFKAYTIKRPFVVVSIFDMQKYKQGIGIACCQLPDLWSETKGTDIALARAAKDLLGISNPHLSEYVLAQTVKEEVPF